MFTRYPALALMLCICCWTRYANAETFAVIVHADNNQVLNEKDIKNIYLDRISHWENGHLIFVYELPQNAKGKAAFCKAILNMSAGQAARTSANRITSNQQHNNTRTTSPNAVLRAVALDANAIGYIPHAKASNNSAVRVVLTFED